MTKAEIDEFIMRWLIEFGPDWIEGERVASSPEERYFISVRRRLNQAPAEGYDRAADGMPIIHWKKNDHWKKNEKHGGSYWKIRITPTAVRSLKETKHD